jgi:hypothetical protein
MLHSDGFLVIRDENFSSWINRFLVVKGTGAEQGVNVAWLQGSQLLQGSSSMGGPSDVLVENSVIETTNLGLRVLLKRQSPLKFVEDVV